MQQRLAEDLHDRVRPDQQPDDYPGNLEELRDILDRFDNRAGDADGEYAGGGRCQRPGNADADRQAPRWLLG